MRAKLRSYLGRHLHSPGLVNLLSQLFPDGTSVFFGPGYFRMFLDYYCPNGGIGAMPAALADAVTGWGGEIRLKARVVEVLQAGGQACGVRLASGEELPAEHVIAASDLRQALTRPLPPAVTLPPRFARVLARMTFEGQPIIFWPDVERFLQELDRLFPDEHDGLRVFYRDLYKMYEVTVLKNELIDPPSEFSSRQGLRRLLSGPIQMIRLQKLLSTSVRSLLDRFFQGEAVINFFDKLCSAYCWILTTAPRQD